MVLVPDLRWLSCAPLLFLLASGCGAFEAKPDPSLASPEATVDTLFRAFAVERLSEADIHRRRQSGARFELVDREAYRACFADFDGEETEGMAGYVFGALVVRKDHLAYSVQGPRAEVTAESDAAGEGPHVQLVRRDGEWKILLRQSVPAPMQARLLDVYRRSRESLARGGRAL